MKGRTVRNVNGSSSRTTSGGWSSKLSKMPSDCQVRGCTKPAKVGAHVVHASKSSSNKEYITAMCYTHNNHHNKSNMVLNKGAQLVRALK